MTQIPKEPMSSISPASESQPHGRQQNSMPSPNFGEFESFGDDSDTGNEQSGNWNFLNAAGEWCRRACNSLSIGEVMRLISRGFSIKFIAVIGLTGAGKSSLIRTLTGKEVYVEHGINAGTTSFAMFPAIIEGHCYVFVDTPGFNDSDPQRTDADVFMEILSWFRQMTPVCDLAGVLYLHDITQPRFSDAARMNLELLQALCGEEYFRNITIITTMWRKLSPDACDLAEETQRQLEEDSWKPLIKHGARVIQHLEGVVEPLVPFHDPRKLQKIDQQREKAKTELQDIVVYYQTSDRIRPQIQRELRANISIFKTRAGLLIKDIWGEKEVPPPQESWWDSFCKVLKWFKSRFQPSSSSSDS